MTPWAFSIYRKNSGNFAGNFHRVKNMFHLFHLTQVPFVPRLLSGAILHAKIKDIPADSLELVKFVNATRIFHRKSFQQKNRTTISDVPLLPAIFHWNDTKSRVTFTFQLEYPKSSGKWKTPFFPKARTNTMSMFLTSP